MSHTPGPWVAYEPTHVGTLDEDGKTICHASVEIDDDTPANMTLIAAAPELLEALEAIHFDISSRGVVNAETQQKMREAIKKAKGL
jgi:RNase P/RNase MRP subunit p30